MADVLYFSMVRCAIAGVTFDQVEQVLDRRALKVTRRPGKAKVALPNNPTMGAEKSDARDRSRSPRKVCAHN